MISGRVLACACAQGLVTKFNSLVRGNGDRRGQRTCCALRPSIDTTPIFPIFPWMFFQVNGRVVLVLKPMGRWLSASGATLGWWPGWRPWAWRWMRWPAGWARAPAGISRRCGVANLAAWVGLLVCRRTAGALAGARWRRWLARRDAWRAGQVGMATLLGLALGMLAVAARWRCCWVLPGRGGRQPAAHSAPGRRTGPASAPARARAERFGAPANIQRYDSGRARKTVHQGQEGCGRARAADKTQEAILARRATADGTGKYGKVGQQRQEGFVSRSS